MFAEFAAEVADVDVDDVGAGVEVVAPDLAEELFAAEDLAGVAEEHLGEGVLASAQFVRVAPDVELSGAEVELGLAGAKGGGFGAGLGPEADADAGEEFLEAEGFGDVVVGSAFEAGRK